MTATQLVTQRDTEAERVLAWRLEELERAGYDRASAWEVAERRDLDLHVAVALARAGCPAETALKILL